MMPLKPIELKKQKRLAITWSVTFLILFPLLILLGLLMRLGQGELMKLLLANFYAFMTLHGLGMAGILFSMAFAALWYLISTRFARLNIRLGYFVYFTILIGITGLAIGTLIGKFGAGWYMLYPLPFKNPTWFSWSIELSIISLIILGVAWLTGILHLLFALSKEYGGFITLVGWKYLRKKEDKKELPPIVLITTVSLVSGIPGFIAGITMMVIYLFKSLNPLLNFDPLLLKNMAFFFGHTFSNVTLYCAAGWLYLLLPEITRREWKINKMLVYAWNATFVFILFGYFHHLYMGFQQPLALKHAAQIASYLSPVPATAITIYGVALQLYHSKIKWGIIPLMFLFGMAGWAIGGFAALINSATVFNKILQNTLWVPAYFHTYILMGISLFILAFIFYLFSTKGNEERDKVAKPGFWLFVTGGYGFVAMLYLGGISSIPGRYARYTGMGLKEMHARATSLSQVSVLFIILLLSGIFILYFSLFAKLRKKR